MSILHWVIVPTRLYLWNQDKGQPNKREPWCKGKEQWHLFEHGLLWNLGLHPLQLLRIIPVAKCLWFSWFFYLAVMTTGPYFPSFLSSITICRLVFKAICRLQKMTRNLPFTSDRKCDPTQCLPMSKPSGNLLQFASEHGHWKFVNFPVLVLVDP